MFLINRLPPSTRTSLEKPCSNASELNTGCSVGQPKIDQLPQEINTDSADCPVAWTAQAVSCPPTSITCTSEPIPRAAESGPRTLLPGRIGPSQFSSSLRARKTSDDHWGLPATVSPVVPAMAQPQFCWPLNR